VARLVFLGRLADLAGCPQADLALAEMRQAGPLGWAGLLGWLAQAGFAPALVDALAGPGVRVALNGALVPDKTAVVLAVGDELALLPPVSGG
jgi:molybdopterin synthase sulfur carrier subunit